MPKRSRNHLSKTQTLSKAWKAKKKSITAQDAASDSEDPEKAGIISEWEDEEESDEEELLSFSMRLQDAQRIAQEKEKEERAVKKISNQPKFYTGSSDHSSRHHTATRKKLADDPTVRFIDSWLVKQPNKKQKMNHEPISVFSSGEEEEEIEEVTLNGTGNNLAASSKEGICITSEQEMESEPDNDDKDVADASEDLKSSSICPKDRLAVEEMLKNLKDNSASTASDAALDALCWIDFPALHQACMALTIKSKDKKIDVVFWTRIASVLPARAANRGTTFARNVRQWIHSYLRTGKLPMHRYGRFHSSILEDEDFKEAIQFRLMEKCKEGCIRAQDVVDIVASAEMQAMLGDKY
ncbi:hypothetical protein M422DRAFT_240405 [Sphaerobolus stellatus SS14]|nr:hypothetical protein M422DRAFT_240405 [Sphaerobolus stellatus SS14]